MPAATVIRNSAYGCPKPPSFGSSFATASSRPMTTVHIIGAGLAGLNTALCLAQKGVAVRLYESGTHAGGRCRSYHDPQLDRLVDNGNHLVFAGNHAARRYLAEIGAT